MKKLEKVMMAYTVVIMLIIIIFGFSYAFFSYNSKQDTQNKFKANCYDIVFKENKDGISLINTYPIDDAEGLKQEPYTLTLTNKCDRSLGFSVYLDVLNESTTDDSLMRLSVDNTIKNLTDYYQIATGNQPREDVKTRYLLMESYLDSKASKTINLKIWMSSKATTGQNTKFLNKINVDIF